MGHHEQFEVLQLHDEKWELVAAFQDMEIATEVARNRKSNVRLVRAAYEGGKRISEEILLDLGSTRDVA
jgi:cytochrome b